MDELERIKQLAGVDKLPEEDSMGENLSYIGTKKAFFEQAASLYHMSRKHVHK